MGRRRRNPRDYGLPPRVYRGRSAYELRLKNGRCIRLCPLDASFAEVWQKYREVMKSLRTDKVTHLLSQYFESAEFARRKPETRKGYLTQGEKLRDVFGEMSINAVRPADVRQFMDKRGAKAPTAANRELALLSTVYAWGYERGLAQLNPCRGVRKFPEQPRRRYVTDEEFLAVYRCATPGVRVAMAISYLCAARQADVVGLTRFQLEDRGIRIAQSKTGVLQIKTWSPALRKAVARGLRCRRRHDCTHVVVGLQGKPYSVQGFRAMFYKAKVAAAERYGIAIDWTFHDIKAKSISDFEGDKSEFSGNKATVHVYDRLPKVVPTHGSGSE